MKQPSFWLIVKRKCVRPTNQRLSNWMATNWAATLNANCIHRSVWSVEISCQKNRCFRFLPLRESDPRHLTHIFFVVAAVVGVPFTSLFYSKLSQLYCEDVLKPHEIRCAINHGMSLVPRVREATSQLSSTWSCEYLMEIWMNRVKYAWIEQVAIFSFASPAPLTSCFHWHTRQL